MITHLPRLPTSFLNQLSGPSVNYHNIVVENRKTQSNYNSLLTKKNGKNNAYDIFNCNHTIAMTERSLPFFMTWYVYIIECNDSSLYTGITNDLDKRVNAHNAGLGAKYTKSRLPVHLRYSEPATNRSQASQREYAIKSLKKSAKINLIANQTAKN